MLLFGWASLINGRIKSALAWFDLGGGLLHTRKSLKSEYL